MLSRRTFFRLGMPNNKISKQLLFTRLFGLPKDCQKRVLYSNLKKFFGLDNHLFKHNMNKNNKLYSYLNAANHQKNISKQNLLTRIKVINKNKNNMIHIGHYKNIGYRDTMEDYMIINSNPKFCFFSILDGHGGSNCVKYLKGKLYNKSIHRK